LPGDERDELLDAARRRLALAQDLDLPALRLRVAADHAEEGGREERRLLAALAAPDLEDRVPLVVRIPRQEQELEVRFELRLLRLELGQLRARELAELRIGQELLVVG